MVLEMIEIALVTTWPKHVGKEDVNDLSFILLSPKVIPAHKPNAKNWNQEL